MSHRVIGCAIEVHKVLGPGLLESAYERCLVHELSLAGLNYKLQHPLPLEYKGVHLDCGYRADVLVAEGATPNDCARIIQAAEDSSSVSDKWELIVEMKAVEALLPIHEAQLLTYMKLARVRIGLLINFNMALLKDGIKRMVL